MTEDTVDLGGGLSLLGFGPANEGRRGRRCVVAAGIDARRGGQEVPVPAPARTRAARSKAAATI